MAKEKSDKKIKKEKKEGKEKKEKRSEKDGVSKPKKEKKSKKLAENGEVAAALVEVLEKSQSQEAPETNGISSVNVLPPPEAKAAVLVGALVPFANPLADEKACKKVLKSVKKAAKNKSLKRGVKEVVKSLRKSPTTGAAPGVVVLAADISPMDVISHIPVLCEDHNVPYIFVPSRAELGAAGSTKRPTSVVMIAAERGGKKKAGADLEEGEEDFKQVYADLVKLVEKESRNVKV